MSWEDAAREDREGRMIEDMITADGPIIPPGPPPPDTWGESQRVANGTPMLTNLASYKGKPNVLFADEATGDLVRYGDKGEEVFKEEGAIPIKKPPGAQPDPEKMNEWEFSKIAIEKETPNAIQFGKDAAKRYKDAIPYSTKVLKENEINLKAAEIERTESDWYLKGVVAQHLSEFKNMRAVEQEKIKNARELAEKTPNEIELLRIMNSPTASPAKKAEAKTLYDAILEGKKAVARESRSMPQQTQFTDPETGEPLVFDRTTGTYKVAPVVGGGGVAPRPVNPSATEREKGSAFAVLKSQLERIKSDYKPEYVGLVSGQVGRVTQWRDADEAAFRQVILDVKDSLLRARSGAQINEQEYARLAKLVPDFTDSEPQFAGKMKSFEATIDEIAKQRAAGQRKGGVKIHENEPAVPPAAIIEKKREGESVSDYLKRTKRK